MKKEGTEKILNAGIKVIVTVVSVIITVISITAEVLREIIWRRWKRN